MGTRSLTVFLDEDGKEIAVLYRQFDGYPEGHGVDLASALEGHVMVNGFSDRNAKVFNGSHDLAVRVITRLKDNASEAGNLYLHAAGSRNLGEDFVYTVHPGKVISFDVGAVISMSVADVHGNRSDNHLTPEGFLAKYARKN